MRTLTEISLGMLNVALRAIWDAIDRNAQKIKRLEERLNSNDG